MIETGVLQLGEHAGLRVVRRFGLEKAMKAFTMAEEHAGMGETSFDDTVKRTLGFWVICLANLNLE